MARVGSSTCAKRARRSRLQPSVLLSVLLVLAVPEQVLAVVLLGGLLLCPPEGRHPGLCHTNAA